MTLENIITHEFNLKEINSAIDLLRSGKAGRIIIKMN
jgi:Zn-dependent alcohol dehydrogenase